MISFNATAYCQISPRHGQGLDQTLTIASIFGWEFFEFVPGGGVLIQKSFSEEMEREEAFFVFLEKERELIQARTSVNVSTVLENHGSHTFI